MDSRPAASRLSAYLVGLAGIGLFSVMDMVMKSASLAIGAYAALWWRGLVTVGLAGLLYAPQRHWPDRRTMRLHALRGLIGAAMSFAFFWGLARVPMAQAVGLTFIAPLIGMALSGWLLKEVLGARLWLGALLALAGVALILSGQWQADLGREALWGSASVIVSALLYAVNIVLLRVQAVAAEPREIGFFQSLFMAIGLAVAIPFIGWPQWPTGQEMALVSAAVMGLVSMLMLAFAYARAPASYLATTEYSALLYAMLLGWLAFGERVSLWTVAGGALIIAGCLLAARSKVDHPAIGEAA